MQIVINSTADLLNFIQLDKVNTKQSIQVVRTFLKVSILFPYTDKDHFINDVKKHIEKFNVNNNPYQQLIILLSDPFEFHNINSQ